MIKNIYQEDKDSEQALFDALYRLMLISRLTRLRSLRSWKKRM